MLFLAKTTETQDKAIKTTSNTSFQTHILISLSTSCVHKIQSQDVNCIAVLYFQYLFAAHGVGFLIYCVFSSSSILSVNISSCSSSHGLHGLN